MRDAKTIVVVGSLNIDLVVTVDHLARPGETIAGGDLVVFTGGKGANQAYAAAKLGGLVEMVGRVGQDSFGAQLLTSLKSVGVDTTHVGISERATGSACISVLPSGENAIVVSPGANATVLPDAVREQLEGVESGGYLLSQLEIPIETVEVSFRVAKNRGITTILDPAPAQPLSRELLKNVSYLTPNQSEAGGLLAAGDREVQNWDDAREVADGLLDLGPENVVLKMGALGCYVAAGEIRAAVEGFPAKAVDTTGAGDVFNAALAVALSEGMGILKAARFANAAAGVSVTRPGAQNSAPSREEVEAFVAERSGTAAEQRV